MGTMWSKSLWAKIFASLQWHWFCFVTLRGHFVAPSIDTHCCPILQDDNNARQALSGFAQCVTDFMRHFVVVSGSLYVHILPFLRHLLKHKSEVSTEIGESLLASYEWDDGLLTVCKNHQKLCICDGPTSHWWVSVLSSQTGVHKKKRDFPELTQTPIPNWSKVWSFLSNLPIVTHSCLRRQ